MPNLTTCGVNGLYKGTGDGESTKVIHTPFGLLKELKLDDIKKWKRGNFYTTFYGSNGIKCDIKPKDGVTFQFGNLGEKKIMIFGKPESVYDIYDINGNYARIPRLFDDIIFWVAKWNKNYQPTSTTSRETTKKTRRTRSKKTPTRKTPRKTSNKKRQTSKKISYSRETRPSPSISATIMPKGTTRVGNDGNQWMIKTNIKGIKRWVKI
jgi:hypothetical protein